MTTMRNVSNIAKFNGQNLLTWKLGCWILFQQHDLVKLVTGEEILPVETKNAEGVVTNTAARATWLEKDLLARSYFIATIEIAQQRSLVNYNTAHEMWLRISTQHLKNAADNQHALEQRFFEYRFHPEHDVMHHITEIETIANQLQDINAPVTESQIVGYATSQKAYHRWSPTERKIKISRDVIFYEQINDNPFSSSEPTNSFFFEQSPLQPSTTSQIERETEKSNPDIQFEPSNPTELPTPDVQLESSDIPTSVPDVSTSTDNQPETSLPPINPTASNPPVVVQPAPNTPVRVSPYPLRIRITKRQ
ncbi:uncharacterized protein LOC116918511 [Daphnia magna]|uniref:uncharacterized protein LOC116918511 n=1 Tax=Daphnia magna TaxID=35525 RepID=UPI001E1BD969|nr:uncharacterized protein LOC116918511 [Daphnia magna]